MKKITTLSLALACVLGLTACNQDKTAQSPDKQTQAQSGTTQNDPKAGEITLHTATGEVKLSANPAPIAVYDMTALQNLAALGVAVQGVPEMEADRVALLNLKAKDTPEGVPIGTVLEPNLEALNALKPQAVFVGSRMAEKSEELAKVAPTYNLTIDTKDVYAATKQQLTDFGALFGKAEEAKKRQAEIDSKIEEVKKAAAGKGTGLAILINGDKMSAYGKNSRYGFLHTTFGIPMADENIQEARHGQPISFEYLQKTDPDWLFVLDRGAAVGEEGKSAQVVLDNPLIHNTKAWKNKQIVYLSPDSYMAFGGYYQWLKDSQIVLDALNKTATKASDTASGNNTTSTTAGSTQADNAQTDSAQADSTKSK